MAMNRRTFLLVPASVASAGTIRTASPETIQWFQKTEQALMDSIAAGDKTVWDRVMDPSCVITSEEGRSVGKQEFLDELRPLPEGLFVVENGRATRIVNLRKFAVLTWTRIDTAA